MTHPAPPQPCRGCIFAGYCEMAGLVNRLAVEAWLVNLESGCADYAADNYHGIEGVRA